MSEGMTEEEKRFVTDRIYTNISEDAVRHNTRGWTSQQIEYGIEHARTYSGMTIAEKTLRAMLPEVRNREETAKSHAIMEALRSALQEANQHHEEAARKEAERQEAERRRWVAAEKTANHRYRLSLWWGAVTFFAGGVVLPQLAKWLWQ